MPDFSPEYSCIESINASYEAKSTSNKRSRGIEEYRAALKEVRRVSRGEPRATTGRQAVRKRPQGSTSIVEPAPKKIRRDLAAEVFLSEAIPSGVEEQKEEEEDEDNVPLIRTRGLRSKGPVILAEGEFANEPTAAVEPAAADEPIAVDDAEQLEVDLMSRDDVEIPGVSTQHGSSSAQERRDEAQQSGSPGILMSSSRIIDPNPTTGVFGGKALIVEASRVELSSSSSEEEGYDSGDEVDFNDEPVLPDPSKFSHISEEETYRCDPVTASPPAAVASAEGIFLVVLLTKLLFLTREKDLTFSFPFGFILQGWSWLARLRLPPISRR